MTRSILDTEIENKIDSEVGTELECRAPSSQPLSQTQMSASELNKQQVYQVLSTIPPGKVTSYGAVARLAGLGQGARFVGYVLRNLPKDSTRPWHRVLKSQGKVSLPTDSPSFEEQITRLKAEGILIKSGKVNLRHHLWQP